MFALRRRTTYLFLAVSLAHILLISSQLQSRTGMSLPKTAAFRAFATAQSGIMSIGDGFRSLWTHYVALKGVAAENATLRERIVALDGQAQQEQALVAEAHALEDAARLQRTLDHPTVVARVIAGDPSPDALTITIDRGSADGIRLDMAVIAVGGVVGRVIQVIEHASQVQLLTGRMAGAGAMLERTNSGGIIEGGAGDPPLALTMVSNQADVRLGDKVFTSGQDGIYPQGLLIGSIVSARKGSGQYKSIAVRPSVDFSHIDLVLVVLAAAAKPLGGGA